MERTRIAACGCGPVDLGRNFEAAAPGHVDVSRTTSGLSKRAIRTACSALPASPSTVTSRSGVQEQTQAGTDKRVIVNDQDTDHNPTRLHAHRSAASPDERLHATE